MSCEYPLPTENILSGLRRGLVIPAHPLALTEGKELDERRQRALSRYYLDAGAGGLAVGVHTTEFKIHEAKTGLYRPVLELAIETARSWSEDSPVMIAGICGATDQAVEEALTARELGYHIGLISLGTLKDWQEDRLIEHARRVAAVIPIMGFYLQPAVGGRILPESFWRKLAEIPNLVAIKIAPFNRYHTLEVVRAVALSGRSREIALYTGNDDAIITDLLTTYQLQFRDRQVKADIVGGLLGHWSYWTKCAVGQLNEVHRVKARAAIPTGLLTLAAQVTEANEAVFDPANNYRGCISGILYTLSLSGLIEEVRTLGEKEELSPGQAGKIERIIRDYPHLIDHDFVGANLEKWLLP
ncbi:MAG: dihydrodipicolinate synthase family protein [Spirochaeta sp.]|nr:dihydrodipicolinate synthase family protein [Spirochaeta sp.]